MAAPAGGSVRDWVQAARLRTLPLAAATAMVGAALAARALHKAGEPLDNRFWGTFVGVLLTVWVLQVLSNFANDYGDAEHGADGAHRTDRAVASGRIAPAAMKRAIVLTAVKALMLGVATVVWAAWGTMSLVVALGFVAAGLVSIGAAYRYTAGRSPYGYRGFGDVAVLAFFGWIGVVGTAVLASGGRFEAAWFLPATFVGAMGMAVLNLNNMRDLESDAQAGKQTVAVRLGPARARRYHAAVVVGGWAALALYLWGADAGGWRGGMWIALLSLVWVKHVVFVVRTPDGAALDGELKKVALGTAVVALFLLLAQTR
jgi:1,4-dihydroxy-2-naphthoate octaprenyltransferase